MSETPLVTEGNTLGDAMSEDAPRCYRQRAMRFPPRRRKRRRSHSSALEDNGSPNNASRRPARPIFELSLWWSWLTQKRSSMISFRPVVEDGVSSRRKGEEIWLSKTRSPLNSRKFSVRCLHGQLVPLLTRRAAGVGITIPFSLWPCVGLRAASADWHSLRSSISQGGLRSALIALRSYPSRACT